MWLNRLWGKGNGTELSHRPPPNSCRTYSIDLCNLAPGPAITSIPVNSGFFVSDAQEIAFLEP